MAESAETAIDRWCLRAQLSLPMSSPRSTPLLQGNAGRLRYDSPQKQSAWRQAGRARRQAGGLLGTSPSESGFGDSIAGDVQLTSAVGSRRPSVASSASDIHSYHVGSYEPPKLNDMQAQEARRDGAASSNAPSTSARSTGDRAPSHSSRALRAEGASVRSGQRQLKLQKSQVYQAEYQGSAASVNGAEAGGTASCPLHGKMNDEAEEFLFSRAGQPTARLPVCTCPASNSVHHNKLQEERRRLIDEEYSSKPKRRKRLLIGISAVSAVVIALVITLCYLLLLRPMNVSLDGVEKLDVGRFQLSFSVVISARNNNLERSHVTDAGVEVTVVAKDGTEYPLCNTTAVADDLDDGKFDVDAGTRRDITLKSKLETDNIPNWVHIYPILSAKTDVKLKLEGKVGYTTWFMDRTADIKKTQTDPSRE